MITIRASRTTNRICSLKSLPLNPPLSSTTRNALRMKIVRTPSARLTFVSSLFQVILRNSKPQRQYTIQEALEEQRTRDIHEPMVPIALNRPYSTSLARQTRSSKVRRESKGRLGKPITNKALEVIGYVGRVLIEINPSDNNAFLIYLICVTIAPVLLCAGIYLCLARIVTIYGTSLYRFKPCTYTIVFCSCDLFSLVLQGLGGGIAATAVSLSRKTPVRIRQPELPHESRNRDGLIKFQARMTEQMLLLNDDII